MLRSAKPQTLVRGWGWPVRPPAVWRRPRCGPRCCGSWPLAAWIWRPEAARSYARAEHRIFTGLRELAKDRAVLLITHRLANVAVADRIIVLDQGQIMQEGTYVQLTPEPGLFRSLWELQRRTGGEASSCA